MDREHGHDRTAKGVDGPSSVLGPSESLVQIWKGYSPSRESMRTSMGSRVLRGERNVGAPEPALLVLTDRRLLILVLKGIFRRKYVLVESGPLEKMDQVETVGPYRTDVRIKGDWGYHSFVEFNRPIRTDSQTLEENGIEDPDGVRKLIKAGSEKAKLMAKK
ncbi:MAG TPA: hypothetical protein VGK23_12565 [Methanomassiliicoccales archaeon]|jgi:hypothetical protein